MEERKLTEKESLEVITSMIARTKQRYLGNGNILLMWGYLVVIISILVWVLLASTGRGEWNWLWLAIPVVGCPVSYTMARREERKYGAVTYSDRVTSQLWKIFAISEILLTLICLCVNIFSGVNCWSAMLLYTLLLAPGAEIAQGLIVKEKCLMAGGFIGLAIGVIVLCCFVGGIPLLLSWFMPLFIIAWVAMMIVPGYILNNKAKVK